MYHRNHTHFFITAGQATATRELNAFDEALLDAGIGDLNIVRISSIIPPGCHPADSIRIPPGALVPTAYGTCSSAAPGEEIAAAVTAALPDNRDLPGVIMEHSGKMSASSCAAIAEELARTAMKSRNIDRFRLFTRSAGDTVRTGVLTVVAAIVLCDGTEVG